MKGGTGPEERNQFMGVDFAPASLRSINELVSDSNSSSSRSRTRGNALPKPNGGNGRFDGVSGSQMDPVFDRATALGLAP